MHVTLENLSIYDMIYLRSVDVCFPTNLIGSIIDTSLFMDTQLGSGEIDLSPLN